MERPLHIAVAVALQDAGEATRALEIAMGIKEACPPGWQVVFTFLSHGSSFEQRVLDQGFKICHCQPKLAGKSVVEDLKLNFPEVVGEVGLAKELMRGELAALSEIKPDLVLHGFWPFASVARRMLGIPGICFLPIPLHPQVVGSSLLKDIPDPVKPLTYLPLPIRRAIVKTIPPIVKRNFPTFKQHNMLVAAQSCGWSGKPLHNLFDLLEADLTLVNDLPDFYLSQSMPDHFRLVGPLFAPAAKDAVLDEKIGRVFDPADKHPKIFCTMGSSGRKEYLLEAVKAFTYGEGQQWKAVILAPPAVCSLSEAVAVTKDRPGLYITDQFVPAPAVNALADLVICHGGQGTVQTALASGAPLVGVAMQMEQQINLDNVVAGGAAIRLPLNRWQSGQIQQAVNTILANPGYRQKAQQLQQSVLKSDGKKNSAEAIWQFITAKWQTAEIQAGVVARK